MENKIIEVEVRTADVIAIEIKTTVRNTQKIMLDAAIGIGRNLVEAKELVEHGEWETWLENSVGFSASSARKYMKIAKEYGQNSKTELIPDLSYTNALKLLALEEEERNDFIKDNNVENMKVKELEEKIKELQNKKGDTEKQLADTETEKELIQQGNAILIDEAKELKEKIEKLEAKITEENNGEEEMQKINETLNENKTLLASKEKELEKEQSKVDKLQKKIDKLEADRTAEIEKATEEAEAKAKEEAAKENEEKIGKLQEEAKMAEELLKEANEKIEKLSKDGEANRKVKMMMISSLVAEIKNDIEAEEDLEEQKRIGELLKKFLTALMESI